MRNAILPTMTPLTQMLYTAFQLREHPSITRPDRHSMAYKVELTFLIRNRGVAPIREVKSNGPDPSDSTGRSRVSDAPYFPKSPYATDLFPTTV